MNQLIRLTLTRHFGSRHWFHAGRQISAAALNRTNGKHLKSTEKTATEFKTSINDIGTMVKGLTAASNYELINEIGNSVLQSISKNEQIDLSNIDLSIGTAYIEICYHLLSKHRS